MASDAFASIQLTNTSNQITTGASAHQLTLNYPAVAASTQTYSTYDTTASCNFKLGLDNPITLSGSTASQSLTLAQSGSIVFLPQCTANVSVSLPAITAGWNCRVVLQAVPDGTHTCTFSAPSANMSGVAVGVAAGLVPVSAASITNLILGATAANAKVGDYVDFSCDGTKYYYRAWSSGTAAAFTTS